MFYTAMSRMLTASKSSLLGGPAGVDDDDRDHRSDRELRQVATFVARVGNVLPDLFRTLDAEIRELEDGAKELRVLSQEVLPLPPPPAESNDPLERYVNLCGWYEQFILDIAPYRHDERAADSLVAARRSLARSADIQGELVDVMLSDR